MGPGRSHLMAVSLFAWGLGPSTPGLASGRAWRVHVFAQTFGRGWRLEVSHAAGCDGAPGKTANTRLRASLVGGTLVYRHAPVLG